MAIDRQVFPKTVTGPIVFAMRRLQGVGVVLCLFLSSFVIGAKAEPSQPICQPGQNSSAAAPCTQPAPASSGAATPTPGPGGSASMGPIGSGFKSAFPPDRSVSAFTNANPDLTGNSYFGVAFDSSARIQMLPYVSVEAQSATGGMREQHLCQDLADSTCAPS